MKLDFKKFNKLKIDKKSFNKALKKFGVKKKKIDPKKLAEIEKSRRKSRKLAFRFLYVFSAIVGIFILVVSLDRAGVTTYNQDGTIESEKITNPAETKPVETIVKKKIPTKCLEPKASDMITAPAGWTTKEDVINDGFDDYNYVKMRSPDYTLTTEGGVTKFTEGAEIGLFVTCDPTHKSVEDIVEFETESRIFKNFDQEPLYLKVRGQDAVQYYFGNVGDPPLITVFFKDGIKYNLQYNYPRESNNLTSSYTIAGSTKTYIDIYKDLLNSVELPQ